MNIVGTIIPLSLTSIETLALILKNKTIRFSSLSNVDDLEEQATEDFGDLGRFCFVSCWSDDSEESIPLWNLYTPNMTGVRIRLPLDPFKVIKVDTDKRYVKEGFFTHPQLTNENLSEFGCSVNPPYIAALFKVQYTNDPEKLARKVYTETKKETNHQNVYKTNIERKLNLTDIGVYKSKKWMFQNEYRYKFFITPWTLAEMENLTVEEHQKMFVRLRVSNLPFDFIDIGLDDTKFRDMEITIGPRANQAQRQIIHSLVNHLNPTATIKESNLKIR